MLDDWLTGDAGDTRGYSEAIYPVRDLKLAGRPINAQVQYWEASVALLKAESEVGLRKGYLQALEEVLLIEMLI